MLENNKTRKNFINLSTGKTWWIEITDTGFLTCLNNGKIKETVCAKSFQIHSKAQSAMKAQMKKGFVYHNPEAQLFEPIAHTFVTNCYTGSMPIGANKSQEDFYVVGIEGQFKDEYILHISPTGEVKNRYSLGAERLSFRAVLQGNAYLYLNNNYRLERFDVVSGENTFLSDTLNSIKMILDGNGERVLYYDGTDLVLSDGNRAIWKKGVSFEKNNTYLFHYYCFGILSDDGNYILYRCSESGYYLVDVAGKKEQFIENTDWGAFFTWTSEYVVIGDKYYSVKDALVEEREILPFPLPNKWECPRENKYVVSNGDLVAVKEVAWDTIPQRGVQIWDCAKRELLATIEDDFIVKDFSMAFAGENLVIYSDYGVVSVYNCKRQAD